MNTYNTYLFCYRGEYNLNIQIKDATGGLVVKIFAFGYEGGPDSIPHSANFMGTWIRIPTLRKNCLFPHCSYFTGGKMTATSSAEEECALCPVCQGEK